MTTDTVPQTVLFPDLFDKPLFAKFNQEQASSDGGGGPCSRRPSACTGWSRAFARCLSDKRAPEKIRHTLADLIGQRIFGIACGHPDCNDAAHLADDPIHKLLLGRDPVAGESLASQPTLSRFFQPLQQRHVGQVRQMRLSGPNHRFPQRVSAAEVQQEGPQEVVDRLVLAQPLR